MDLTPIQYGAVAFLYHPCAPLGEVMKLKRLARSCLQRHVITPSRDLPQDMVSICVCVCVCRFMTTV